MRWHVTGADASSGAEVETTVEALTQEEAEKIAHYNGILVSAVGKTPPAAVLAYQRPAPGERSSKRERAMQLAIFLHRNFPVLLHFIAILVIARGLWLFKQTAWYREGIMFTSDVAITLRYELSETRNLHAAVSYVMVGLLTLIAATLLQIRNAIIHSKNKSGT